MDWNVLFESHGGIGITWIDFNIPVRDKAFHLNIPNSGYLAVVSRIFVCTSKDWIQDIDEAEIYGYTAYSFHRNQRFMIDIK